MKLWVKILIGLFAGVVAGAILGPNAVVLKPVGQIFLNLISMIVPLLVLSSMTVGITGIHDPKKLGRIGFRSMAVFLITTMIAIGFGLFFAKLFAPGEGMLLQSASEIKINTDMTLGKLFMSIVPTNPVAALGSSNVLQIILFAGFLGTAINFAGAKGKPLLGIIESLADVMYKMTGLIMELSPIGVFAIMAWVAGSFGLAIFLPLVKFLLAYYTAALVHLVLIFVGMLYFMVRVNPIPFFKGMRDAIVMAFSTCSSSASLQISMHCVQENLGVSKNITRFVMPLGTTVNMNGAAIFQGMSAVFVAQAYGISLDNTQLLTIVITGTLAAIGAPGVPGAGIIMSSIVFTSVGLPIEGIAILAGIDRLREMVSTVLNILGDAVTAVYIAQVEGELDEKRYYQGELVAYQSVD